MDLATQLRRDEGVRQVAYKDIFGNWTIGVGHKVLLPTEAHLLTGPLTDDQVTALLQADIAAVQGELSKFSWYRGLCETDQAGCANMAFNMGVHGLLEFPSMLHYLRAGNRQGARDEALDSLWARQLGYNPADPLASRPGRIAAQFLTGAWQ